MNAEIAETTQATILGLGMQIPEIPAQRKFVSEECHSSKNRRYERGYLGNYQR